MAQQQDPAQKPQQQQSAAPQPAPVAGQQGQAIFTDYASI
ncbi:hypothetical protein SAMN06265173_12937 [Thalassovita litoralis]|jgi:hypothetical protein|uniref:Uncharacterized protein n=1 Tax=Thalassovita litoralis TaxID=1010611 RepID=A0A521FHT3_9RHOB|nr:hypothetical protein SAMN06265173_12937 [Thalassovita litoralis]